MKKLLIVTSEPLNPENILASTFELSQAQILSSSFETAIISVIAQESLSAKIKLLIKKIIGRPVTNISYGHLLGSIKEIIFFLVFKQKMVRRHIIEGIKVYEGVGYFFISSAKYKPGLRVWLRAGINAYEAYSKENGSADIIHAHGRFLNAGALALAINKTYKIPYVYTDHSTYYQRHIAPEESKPILSAVIDHAAVFTVVSPSLLQYIEKFMERKYPQTVVIPNAVDRIFESPLEEFPESGQVFTFLTVASLEKKKSIDSLLKAFKKAFGGNLRYILKICGDGPLRNQLEMLRNELGLQNVVEFLGQRSKQEVKELFDKANIFVLPSAIETFGVVVIEALSRGCPVIATRSGGPEYILNEQCGVLIEPGNEEGLAAELKAMVDNYGRYDRNDIREYALAKYGSRKFLSTMSDTYKSLQPDGYDR